MALTKILGRLGIVIIIGLFCLNVYGDEEKQRTWKFIEEISLGPEFSSNRGTVHRWVEKPRLSVFGGTAEEEKVVEEVVREINSVLEKLEMDIVIEKPSKRSATLKVFFKSYEKFGSIASKYDFQYVPGNIGYFYTFWNERNEINRAYVLLANDRLKGNELKHFALEEITQSLGLSNDSSIFPKSIFYQNGTNGGDAVELAELDRMVLRFLYRYIKPGDTRKELLAAYEKNWEEIELDFKLLKYR